MGKHADDLKEIARLRKAMLPLLDFMRLEANEEFTYRLEKMESTLEKLAERESNITVKAPDVNVTVNTEEIVAAIRKLEASGVLQKSALPESARYEPHDQSGGGVSKYNGFVADDGSWYIQRVSKGEQRYAKGKGGYMDAWEKRTKLPYGYLSGEK